MKISRKNLKIIIESLLNEDKYDKEYICPNCGHNHSSKGDISALFKNGKCVKCGFSFKGKDRKSWKIKKINEEVAIRSIEEQRKRRKGRKKKVKKKDKCPTATLDISVNTANRDRARKLDWIMYGPLNVEFPGSYWKRIARKWGTSPKAAKKSNCGNCVAFDRSPKMVDKCIPAITSEPVADEFGVLGYCWMHHFKCHSARTCNTWAAGGPIKTDESSAEWFERNKAGALKKEPIDPDLYKDDAS